MFRIESVEHYTDCEASQGKFVILGDKKKHLSLWILTFKHVFVFGGLHLGSSVSLSLLLYPYWQNDVWNGLHRATFTLTVSELSCRLISHLNIKKNPSNINKFSESQLQQVLQQHWQLLLETESPWTWVQSWSYIVLSVCVCVCYQMLVQRWTVRGWLWVTSCRRCRSEPSGNTFWGRDRERERTSGFTFIEK